MVSANENGSLPKQLKIAKVIQSCFNHPYAGCETVFKVAQVDYSLCASALTPDTVTNLRPHGSVG
jgi:hypothetical protein